jgi:hypothetical protein
VGPALSAGSGRGFGVCFGSVLSLSSLLLMDSPPSGPCLLDAPDSAKEPICRLDTRLEGLDSGFGGAGVRDQAEEVHLLSSVSFCTPIVKRAGKRPRPHFT